MQDLSQTDSDDEESTDGAEIVHICYVGPPEAPMLVEREREVVDLKLNTAKKDDECPETMMKSTSANQNQTYLSPKSRKKMTIT